MLFKSTCKFLIKVLHINISWLLTAASETKLFWEKKKNKINALLLIFSLYTPKSIRAFWSNI